jgi:hypothetical protein
VVLPKRTRLLLGTLGAALILLGAAVWILPVAISDGRLIKREVHHKHSTVEVSEEFLGWGALHSLEMAIAFLAAGLFVVLMAMLPAGALKKLSTPVGEMEFAPEVLSQVIDVTAEQVSKDEIKNVVPEVLTELKRNTLEPSRNEIEETISRVVEREEEES